jgi:hypothetical protein
MRAGCTRRRDPGCSPDGAGRCGDPRHDDTDCQRLDPQRLSQEASRHAASHRDPCHRCRLDDRLRHGLLCRATAMGRAEWGNSPLGASLGSKR